ncbi:MAG: hypothetical protein U9Q58_02835, partial [Pseudomonadota bacterium]|nr:hypothetical protein [Pseudomonadota bacterium]
DDLSGKIEVLGAKFDKLDARVDKLDAKTDHVNDNLGGKIGAVATDLKCHREDTEIHSNYCVSEG